MPKCRISPPARTMPVGPDIAPVHHGRGADDQQQVGAAADQPVQRTADRLPRGGRSCTGGSRVPVSAVMRASVMAIVLSVTLSFRPGSSRHHQADLQVPERMQRNGGGPGAPAFRPPTARAGHRERDDLDGRDQVLRRHHGVIRQRADGERLVDRVQPVDARRIDTQQSRHLGRPGSPARSRRATARSAATPAAWPAGRRRCPPARRRVPAGRRSPRCGRRRAAPRSPPRPAASPCGSSARRPAGCAP